MEEPNRIQSMGSQRVGHDRETKCLSEGIIQILCTDLEVKSLINFTSG